MSPNHNTVHTEHARCYEPTTTQADWLECKQKQVQKAD
jgi:hypothetical protein